MDTVTAHNRGLNWKSIESDQPFASYALFAA